MIRPADGVIGEFLCDAKRRVCDNTLPIRFILQKINPSRQVCAISAYAVFNQCVNQSPVPAGWFPN
jgi:hypothetical protein